MAFFLFLTLGPDPPWSHDLRLITTWLHTFSLSSILFLCSSNHCSPVSLSHCLALPSSLPKQENRKYQQVEIHTPSDSVQEGPCPLHHRRSSYPHTAERRCTTENLWSTYHKLLWEVQTYFSFLCAQETLISRGCPGRWFVWQTNEYSQLIVNTGQMANMIS